MYSNIHSKPRISGEARKRVILRDILMKTGENMPSMLYQTKLIADMAFGDGTLIRRNKNTILPTLKIAHGLEQTDYLLWKSKQLHNLAIDHTVKTRKAYIELFTKGEQSIKNAHTMLYTGKLKIFSHSYSKMIDAMSIAIHFMDDGTKSTTARSREKKWTYVYEKPFIKHFRFCMCNFSFEEVARYGAMLYERFAIANRTYMLKSGNGTYPHLLITSTDAKKRLVELLQPNIIPSMQYKIEGPLSRKGLAFEKVFHMEARNDYQSVSAQ